MTICPNTVLIYEDKLTKRWYCPCCGWRSQGKRLPYSSPFLERKIQKLYVTGQSERAIRLLATEKGLGYTDAIRHFNQIRGVSERAGKRWLLNL